MKPFNFHHPWICSEEFALLKPRNVFHRENQTPAEPAADESLRNLHMLVRGNFSVPKAARKVVIRITADDYYKLWINNRFIGQGPAPGYHFCYYYNEYDISGFVHQGENAISLDVYYQGLINRVWNSGDNRQGMVADILVDGRVVDGTNSSWEYTYDPRYVSDRITGYDTQYLEDYDSRQVPDGWRPVCTRDTDYRFEATPQPPLQRYRKSPRKVERLSDGTLWLDFGEEITASLSIHATGQAGDRLVLRCGEELDENGRVRYHLRCNCNYEEIWTLAEGNNDYENYDYKAFRYVEILPETACEIPSVQVEAIVRHYPFKDDACTLTCSDPVLEQVFSLCKNGVKYGSQEVFVDCPTREKGQYAGDLLITGTSHLYLTGAPRLFKKAIENLAQSQLAFDGLLAVAPGSLMQEIADYSLQFPLLLWQYYQYTGDKKFLRDMVPVCDRLAAHFRQFSRPDGLLENVDSWNLVDWPENHRDNYDFPLTKPVGPGCHSVLNAFYVGCIATIEQIKAVVGVSFSPEAEPLRAAFNRVFLDAQTGCYVDREGSDHTSLHANAVPVFLGLEPEYCHPAIGDLLEKKGMCCSVYMSYFYLKALAKCGKYQAVYDLITATGAHSWYNMIREGGTTCFEAWGKAEKWNTSLCHPWASSPVSVLVEDLLGVKTAEPGKAIFTVSPHLPAHLHLNMQIPFPTGTLKIQVEGGDLSWNFSHDKP